MNEVIINRENDMEEVLKAIHAAQELAKENEALNDNGVILSCEYFSTYDYVKKHIPTEYMGIDYTTNRIIFAITEFKNRVIK